MCGIAGKVYFDVARSVDPQLLLRMASIMSHRGPDDGGLLVAGPAGLAHRRLSIIDLTTGRQPMSNEDESVHIVFNGEIYNFRILRDELLAKGHRFRTVSDTEVIVHLYEEDGANCVHRLHGMFAFALWDERACRLVLARDRVGKKPLYYFYGSEFLAFASELKGLLQDAEIPRRLDLWALDDYLTYQYIPPPRTIFEGISKLPPAHVLVLDAQSGRFIVSRYWRLHYRPKLALPEHEALERLDELMRQAVRLRLVADVPVGAMLSGGVDSSLVVALMSQLTSRPVQTFSVGFDEKDYNELPFARTVAKRYQTEHKELICRPDACDVLPRLVWHCDEPFGDSSAMPSYYLAQVISRHVKVALNGDGGDESFAGYERYMGNRLLQYFHMIPRPLRRILLAVLYRLPGHEKIRLMRRLKWLAASSLKPVEAAYQAAMIIFHAPDRMRLYSPELMAALRIHDSLDFLRRAWEEWGDEDPIDRMLGTDVETYLPEDLLVKMDRMSMAHGLEVRSPFLDHTVMEWAACLPQHMKLRGATLKYLTKKLAERYLPREVIHRPKQGFGVPLAAWFRGPLRLFTEEVFHTSTLARDGLLRREAMLTLLAQHQAGFDHNHRLWLLLVLEFWYRLFFKGPLTHPAA